MWPPIVLTPFPPAPNPIWFRVNGSSLQFQGIPSATPLAGEAPGATVPSDGFSIRTASASCENAVLVAQVKGGFSFLGGRRDGTALFHLDGAPARGITVQGGHAAVANDDAKGESWLALTTQSSRATATPVMTADATGHTTCLTAIVVAGHDLPWWPLLLVVVLAVLWYATRERREHDAHDQRVPLPMRIAAAITTPASWAIGALVPWRQAPPAGVDKRTDVNADRWR